MELKELAQKKVAINTLGFILVVAGIFALGASYGYARHKALAEQLSVEPNELLAGTDFTPFWRAWQILSEKHIDNASVTSNDKVWGAIKGLAGAYNDPYTEFFPPICNPKPYSKDSPFRVVFCKEWLFYSICCYVVLFTSCYIC
jgi:hypothetical protein